MTFDWLSAFVRATVVQPEAFYFDFRLVDADTYCFVCVMSSFEASILFSINAFSVLTVVCD